MQTHAEIPTLEHIKAAFVPILIEKGVLKAIVFGSYARGEADQYSDLDIIIVAVTDKRFLQRHKDFPEIFDVWRKGIDLLIYTPEEFLKMQTENNPFIEHALGNGITIYEK